jgi:hypothetical protein
LRSDALWLMGRVHAARGEESALSLYTEAIGDFLAARARGTAAFEPVRARYDAGGLTPGVARDLALLVGREQPELAADLRDAFEVLRDEAARGNRAETVAACGAALAALPEGRSASYPSATGGL